MYFNIAEVEISATQKVISAKMVSPRLFVDNQLFEITNYGYVGLYKTENAFRYYIDMDFEFNDTWVDMLRDIKILLRDNKIDYIL